MNTPTKKQTLFASAFAAIVAGLCCFSPVVIVLFGFGSVAFAGSLADTLYGEYRWYFRAAGILLIFAAFAYWYFKASRNCTLDEKRRLRQKYLNSFLISTTLFVLFYTIWLYGIVEIIGVNLGIWELPIWFGGEG